MTTIISFHRDHTYALPVAYSLNVIGTGVFSVMDDSGNVTSVEVEPGHLLRFNCKLRHQFTQTSDERVGLFWWQLQQSKGYLPNPELQAAINSVDAELDLEASQGLSEAAKSTLAEVGITEKPERLPIRTRQVISGFGLGDFGGLVAQVSSRTIDAIVKDLAELEFSFDPSRYVRNREIRWLGAEPDLRNRTGKLNEAPVNRRILKFIRRVDPNFEIALVGQSWLDF